MNIRTTKIVAPLVAMALCTPNIAFAQEESNLTTISRKTAVNDDFSLTRSISAINRNNSTSQEPNTIYVNPGDTIHVELDLKGKPDKDNHGFTSFKEEVSPIQEFSASSGSLTFQKSHSSEPKVTTLDKLPNNDTFNKIDERTIEFKANSVSHFGELGNRSIIKYSYKAGNKLGTYQTQFQPHQNFTSSPFDPEKLSLTVVVKSKDRPTPPDQDERPAPPDQDERPAPPDQDERPAPPDQDERPAPPDQDERPAPPDQDDQVIPPKSKNSTVFSWFTKTLGVLALLGGTVWFIIKHIFHL